MEADPSLPGWGGWFAPPPTTDGGRAIIQRRMKFVAHRLANWRVGAHVRKAMVSKWWACRKFKETVTF
jgi:hypothetical protein